MSNMANYSYTNPALNVSFPTGVIQAGQVVCYGGDLNDQWFVDQVVLSKTGSWIRATRIIGRVTDPSKSTQQTFPDGVMMPHPSIVVVNRSKTITVDTPKSVQRKAAQSAKIAKADNVVSRIDGVSRESRLPSAATKSGEQPPAKKRYPTSIDDPVARLLGECADLAEMWRLFECVISIVGTGCKYDLAETHSKIDHLQNGLQRMGLGNRIRAMHKSGTIDIAKYVWSGEELELAQ